MKTAGTFIEPGSAGKMVRDLLTFMHKLQLWDEVLTFNDAYEVPFEYMDRIHIYIPVESYQPRAK